MLSRVQRPLNGLFTMLLKHSINLRHSKVVRNHLTFYYNFLIHINITKLLLKSYQIYQVISRTSSNELLYVSLFVSDESLLNRLPQVVLLKFKIPERLLISFVKWPSWIFKPLFALLGPPFSRIAANKSSYSWAFTTPKFLIKKYKTMTRKLVIK